MKAIELLKADRDYCICINQHTDIIAQYDEAIQELEDIKKNINSSIEEIEYALAKPEYASVYLNNALRYLKEKDVNETNK